MSIANFSELRTQIASWLNRTDLTTAQLSLFVQAAESDIKKDLFLLANDAQATGTVVNNEITIPSDLVSMRTLSVDDTVLKFLPPAQFDEREQAEYTDYYYTVLGTKIKVLGGTDYVLTYKGALTALSADGDTNWLLTNSPDIYLWAGCKYGAVFLRDPAGAEGYHVLYRSAVDRMNASQTDARYGGPMVVRVA